MVKLNDFFFKKRNNEEPGFSDRWKKLILKCITIVSFFVLINGRTQGLIQPQRGLKQGYPLFPYIFITCAEAFSNMLMQV